MLTKEFPLKRFIVFSYDTYYPLGGFNDAQGWSSSLEQVKQWASERKNMLWEPDFYFVLDSQTGERIDLPRK